MTYPSRLCAAIGLALFATTGWAQHAGQHHYVAAKDLKWAAVPSLPAGAPLPTGASIASMSEQYAHPRPGPVPAAGASAWVPPAPACGPPR